MTAETKAPLPETAARCGESQPGSKTDNGIPGAAVLLPDEIVARLLWSIDGAIGHQLRAHIAAMAAEIEELKSDNATLYKGQQDMCADIREKQAEIERLMGIGTNLKNVAVKSAGTSDCVGSAVIKAAREWELIAPKQPKPCKTCGGMEFVQAGVDVNGAFYEPCPTCNGTGKSKP